MTPVIGEGVRIEKSGMGLGSESTHSGGYGPTNLCPLQCNEAQNDAFWGPYAWTTQCNAPCPDGTSLGVVGGVVFFARSGPMVAGGLPVQPPTRCGAVRASQQPHGVQHRRPNPHEPLQDTTPRRGGMPTIVIV